jgi:hypothetical protein
MPFFKDNGLGAPDFASGGTQWATNSHTIFSSNASYDTYLSTIPALPLSGLTTGAQTITGVKTFSSLPIAPTAATNDNTTQLATTAYVQANKTVIDAAIALKANLASPVLTGTPVAPTAAVGTDTTQLATTAFVNTAVDERGGSTVVDQVTTTVGQNTITINVPAYQQNAVAFTIYVRWPSFTSNNQQAILLRANGINTDGAYRLLGVSIAGSAHPNAIPAITAFRWAGHIGENAAVLSKCDAAGQNLGFGGATVEINFTSWSITNGRHIANVRLGDYTHQVGTGVSPPFTSFQILCRSEQTSLLTNFPIGTTVLVLAHGIV